MQGFQGGADAGRADSGHKRDKDQQDGVGLKAHQQGEAQTGLAEAQGAEGEGAWPLHAQGNGQPDKEDEAVGQGKALDKRPRSRSGRKG